MEESQKIAVKPTNKKGTEIKAQKRKESSSPSEAGITGALPAEDYGTLRTKVRCFYVVGIVKICSHFHSYQTQNRRQ